MNATFRPLTTYTGSSQHTLGEAHTLRLEDLADGVADLLRVRREDTGGADLAVEHELHRNTARHTDVERHGRVSAGLAVRLERRRDRVLLEMQLAYNGIQD